MFLLEFGVMALSYFVIVFIATYHCVFFSFTLWLDVSRYCEPSSTRPFQKKRREREERNKQMINNLIKREKERKKKRISCLAESQHAFEKRQLPAFL